MKNPIFTGVATALITPMKDKLVDLDAFGRLIEWQIESGIDALVVNGTTGENPTLSDEEQKQTIKFCIDKVDKRVPVIAGTGTYDTAHSVELSKYADKCGADAILLVTPYYNKATQDGLIQHYSTIADSVSCQCILYNVPGRTGCNITPETCYELSKHPKINAVKEASGDLSQVAKIASMCRDNLNIYSGNDDQIVPIMSLGGLGVISVLSNIAPKETVKMAHCFTEGDLSQARDIQLDLLPLINSLFCEVNPIPVKAACGLIGYGDGSLRLPLTKMTDANFDNLKSLMRENGLI